MEKQQKTHKGRTTAGIVFLFLFAVVSVLGFVFYDEIHSGWFQSDPTPVTFLNNLLSLAPRIVGSMQALFVALLVLYLIGLIYKKIFRGSARRVTVGKLVGSITKVVIWVIAVIAVLAVWGVNVGALVAGAGVLTLVVGLGMQSLIADVVAGIFLVCDGTLEVGDIVMIDGWRGNVLEIGIRTTKLINASNDIRVCNNSTITTYINQSRQTSYPLVTVGVPYEEDIKKIEQLFADNRDKLKERLPLVLDGPDFKGVDSLGDSSVNLLFGASCKECDFFQVQRDMRGVIKQFLEENGISIPFPQVVVHGADGEKHN